MRSLLRRSSSVVTAAIVCLSALYGCGGGDSIAPPYLSNQTLRIFLRDDICYGWTFFEDDLHGTVLGVNPKQISISDGGFFCEFPPDMVRPGTNVTLTETITPG